MPDRNEGYAANGWSEYQRLVLSRLDDLKDLTARNANRIGKIEVRLALLEAKARTWGALAGTIAAIVMTAIFNLVVAYLS